MLNPDLHNVNIASWLIFDGAIGPTAALHEEWAGHRSLHGRIYQDSECKPWTFNSWFSLENMMVQEFGKVDEQLLKPHGLAKKLQTVMLILLLWGPEPKTNTQIYKGPSKTAVSPLRKHTTLLGKHTRTHDTIKKTSILKFSLIRPIKK